MRRDAIESLDSLILVDIPEGQLAPRMATCIAIPALLPKHVLVHLPLYQLRQLVSKRVLNGASPFDLLSSRCPGNSMVSSDRVGNYALCVGGHRPSAAIRLSARIDLGEDVVYQEIREPW